MGFERGCFRYGYPLSTTAGLNGDPKGFTMDLERPGTMREAHKGTSKNFEGPAALREARMDILDPDEA